MKHVFHSILMSNSWDSQNYTASIKINSSGEHIFFTQNIQIYLEIHSFSVFLVDLLIRFMSRLVIKTICPSSFKCYKCIINMPFWAMNLPKSSVTLSFTRLKISKKKTIFCWFFQKRSKDHYNCWRWWTKLNTYLYMVSTNSATLFAQSMKKHVLELVGKHTRKMFKLFIICGKMKVEILEKKMKRYLRNTIPIIRCGINLNGRKTQ